MRLLKLKACKTLGAFEKKIIFQDEVVFSFLSTHGVFLILFKW